MDRLDAYHDGELSGLARRRVERHLERCSGCRSELGRLGVVAEVLRETAEAPAPAASLWAEIQPRLAAIDAARTGRAAPTWRARGREVRRRLRALLNPLPWIAHPAGTAAAIALLLVAIVVGTRPQEPVGQGVVRWLDAHGSSVMLIEEEEATIIWLMDPDLDDFSTTGRLARAVI